MSVQGADRQSFLNNFCTNDIKRLVPGTSCEAFFCNVKGRVIGHGLNTCRDDELVIIGPPGQGESLVAHLDRYVIREDVALHDRSAARAYVVVFGSNAANQLAESAGLVIAKYNVSDHLHNRAAAMDGVNVWWIEWPLVGPGSVLIETTPSELHRVESWLQRQGATSCEQIAFEAARIEAGMPLFGIDFDDRNFPQEVARDRQAISFTKGCYLGQETVARIDALGHVNQSLAGVRFGGSKLPEPGAELSAAGKNAGHVTSSARSTKLNAPMALAMIRREHTAVGSQLESTVGMCEVVALPV